MKNLLIVCIILSVIGLLDAGSLTISHYQNFSLPCSFSGGCDMVTKSAYSTIGGVPVALLGVGYYLTVLILSILTLRNPRYAKWLLALVLTGFAWSLWFVYVQLYILEAICQYCMVSALTTTLLFLGTLGVIKYNYDQA